MNWRPFVLLYAVFFLYRFTFWDHTWKEFMSIFTNSFFDALVSLLTARFVYNVLEKYLKSKHPMLFAGAALVTLLAAFVILVGLHWVGYNLAGGMSDYFKRSFSSFAFQVFDVITVVLVGAVGSYSYFKFIEADKNRRLADELRLEKQAAELQALKDQINPHFIFNSLNGIYFTIDKENIAGREMVASFADLLRYQLYECDKPLVPVENEVEFLNRYLYLQRLRVNERMYIEFEHPVTQAGLIPPLLLNPLVENAIKHAGNFKSIKSIIQIKLEASDGRLYFSVFNTKGPENAKEKWFPDAHGIGHSNVRRRLELIFKEDFELAITETDDTYLVKLEIPLQ